MKKEIIRLQSQKYRRMQHFVHCGTERMVISGQMKRKDGFGTLAVRMNQLAITLNNLLG